MRAIVFDLDSTLFKNDDTPHEDVASLLAILGQLGYAVGGISSGDHRALVRLDEAGIRKYFTAVICSDHTPTPKDSAGIHLLAEHLGMSLDDSVFISHIYHDVVLAKKAGMRRAIGVAHAPASLTHPLYDAGADHVVHNISAILDVLE